MRIINDTANNYFMHVEEKIELPQTVNKTKTGLCNADCVFEKKKKTYPDVKLDVLIAHSFDIKSDSRYSRYRLTKFEFVEDS